ncbi:MAG: FAD-dependent oxidoreductase [Rhodobiaceae bacterium]|nr:FAD-dependent oxidoreductase [Rhodobiaceae bacterium]MCC0052881.1 FAD-dependent oxidoreductase [Rhodobiaceae bacterium]
MREETADVVVIGAGPAGLSAATHLRRLGVVRVIVLERDRLAGGIPRHCGHFPFGMREFHRVLRGPDYARRLVTAARSSGVDLRLEATVTRLNPGGHVEMTTPEGLASVRAHAVLLATGVRETSRAGRLIGGEKPGGILSTGALQGIVYLNGEVPFRRPVILGSELVSFSALLTCRHAGMRPVAMIEAGSRPVTYAFARLLPVMLGIPFMAGTRVEAVEGRERVERVVVSRGGERCEIDADGVVVSGQFRPEATLLRTSGMDVDANSGGPVIDQHGRMSDPAYFAAGNVLRGVETAGWCWAEGKRIAGAIKASLDGRLPPRSSSRIAVDAPTLKLAVPQVLSHAAGEAPYRHLQIRLGRPARGTLRLMQGDVVLARKRIFSRPERRILLVLPAAISPGNGVFRLELDED